MRTNTYPLKVGAKSETGYVRSDNQDCMSWESVPLGQLFIVADGMGGHAGGARAAQLTVNGLERHLSDVSEKIPIEEAIRCAFEKTNRDVYTQAHAGDPETEGMGSTAVMLLITTDYIAKIAHVGDSRAYLYHNRKLSLLTKDHTHVQRMVEANMLTPEQARVHPSASILERAMGSRPTVTVDINSVSLCEGDGILLCSDGLSGYADDREIEAILDDSLSPQENVDRLINMALLKGGKDNVTIQFVRFGENNKDCSYGNHKKFKTGFLFVLIIAALIVVTIPFLAFLSLLSSLFLSLSNL